MKEDQLTPWFPAEVKPVHVGLYQTTFGVIKIGWSYWDGKKWGLEFPQKRMAKFHSPGTDGNQYKKWRGLRSKP